MQPYKKILMMGSTPHLVLKSSGEGFKDDLLNYFLYIYELSLTVDTFREVRNIKKFLCNEVEGVIRKYNLNIKCLCRYWWLLGFVMLKKISAANTAYYAEGVINNIIAEINQLSIQELQDYANDINLALLNGTNECLSIRPLEAEKLGAVITDTEEMLRILLDNKVSLIKLFKKHLHQKDIRQEAYKAALPCDRRITMKYTTFWDSFFEIFVGYFTSLNYDWKNDFLIDNELYNHFRKIIMNFLVTFTTIPTVSQLQRISLGLAELLSREVIEFYSKAQNQHLIQ